MSHISIIENHVKTHLKRGVTVADVATRTGLSLMDAECALYKLSDKHKGHISVTKNGILVFSFPQGFNKKVPRKYLPKNKLTTQQLETRQKILTLIRANKGRIGWTDILRVTGFMKEEIDRFLISLLVEFEGDIQVINNGVIVYSFVSLRKTAQYNPEKPRKQEAKYLKNFWLHKERRRTNNNHISKILLFFCLAMTSLCFKIGHNKSSVFLVLLLSILVVIFKKSEKKVEQQRGRRGIIKTIFENIEKRDFFYESELIHGYRMFAKINPCPQYLRREIIRLGGDGILHIDGKFGYCFGNLAHEIRSLKKEREEANVSEAKLTKIIFTSKEKKAGAGGKKLDDFFKQTAAPEQLVMPGIVIATANLVPHTEFIDLTCET